MHVCSHTCTKKHTKQFWVKLTECGLIALSIAVLSKKKKKKTNNSVIYCIAGDVHCKQTSSKQTENTSFVVQSEFIYLICNFLKMVTNSCSEGNLKSRALHKGWNAKNLTQHVSSVSCRFPFPPCPNLFPVFFEKNSLKEIRSFAVRYLHILKLNFNSYLHKWSIQA